MAKVDPNTVRDELLATHLSLPGFCRSVYVNDRTSVNALLSELDPGEAEAIVLAKEKNAVLLIDEVEGREVAAREGIHFIGLLGVLVQAKISGHISQVRDVMAEMESKTTFFVSREIRDLVLKKVGEL